MDSMVTYVLMSCVTALLYFGKSSVSGGRFIDWIITVWKCLLGNSL